MTNPLTFLLGRARRWHIVGALSGVLLLALMTLAWCFVPEYQVGEYVVLALRRDVGLQATFAEGVGWVEPMVWPDIGGRTTHFAIDRGYSRRERLEHWFGGERGYSPNADWYRRTSLQRVEGEHLFVVYELDDQRIVEERSAPPSDHKAAACVLDHGVRTFGATLRPSRETDWMRPR